jgi:hypothetical protein
MLLDLFSLIHAGLNKKRPFFIRPVYSIKFNERPFSASRIFTGRPTERHGDASRHILETFHPKAPERIFPSVVFWEAGEIKASLLLVSLF